MSIIKKPVITEKMTDQSEKYNRFAFVVDRKANKIEIKKAVEDMYDVAVDSVRTMVCIGKKRVRGTKSGMVWVNKHELYLFQLQSLFLNLGQYFQNFCFLFQFQQDDSKHL